MKDNFKLVTETMHVDNSRGEIDNALNISQDLLEKREVVIIDIANDPIEPKDYKKDQDPTLYHSEKTGRGPLKDDWIKKATPTMTCYKLVTVEFKWFGLQNKIESFIQNVMRSLFTNFHRQLFCWTDKWYGMTMDDIRAYEDKTKYDLDEVFLQIRFIIFCQKFEYFIVIRFFFSLVQRLHLRKKHKDKTKISRI